MKKARILIAAAVILSLLAFSPAVNAQESSGGGDWEFSLAPLYGWFVSISGDTTVRGRTGSIEMDFGDIWDSLEFIFTAHFESWYRNQWGFLLDYSYTTLGGDFATAGPTLNIDFTNNIVEFAALYRHNMGPHNLDLFAGGRYNRVEVDLDIGGVVSGEGHKSWTDPMVGARWMWSFAEGWTLSARGDIGGFGVASDSAWSAVGVVQWQPWKNVALVAGYKALSTDYKTGSGAETFAYDVTMSGPIAGINILW
jgi:hypothetical protein